MFATTNWSPYTYTRRSHVAQLAGLVLAAGLAGCLSTTNPVWPTLLVPEMTVENPLFIPQSHRPDSYELVFRKTTEAIAAYFPIAYSNRYDGRIETEYLVSAGWLEPWNPVPYDHYEATETTLQSVRRRCVTTIIPAEAGGYYVEVKVFKELEDVPQPSHASAGAVIQRLEETPGRMYVVPTTVPFAGQWIPMGRDHALEQAILLRIKQCL
ncbi:hypothetical protein HRbin36_01429 [bacterium HR36]|nr:hypothetical protein HRbin36_01429 [bacterium HR36]